MRLADSEHSLDLGAVQHRPLRTACCRAILRQRYFSNLAKRAALVSTGNEDCPSELRPGYCWPPAEMVCPPISESGIGRSPCHPQDRPGYLVRTSRAAGLVSHYADLRLPPGQAKHRTDKVPSMWAKYPRRPQDEMFPQDIAQRLLASQLTPPVYIEGVRRVRLPEIPLTPAKDVVRRDVNHREPNICASTAEDLHASRIDFEGSLRISFGGVHPCISGKINDNRGRPSRLLGQSLDGTGIPYVQFLLSKGNMWDASSRRLNDQLPSHLSMGAGDKEVQGSYSGRCPRFSNSESVRARESASERIGSATGQSISTTGSSQASECEDSGE